MQKNRVFVIGFKRKKSTLIEDWTWDETEFEIEDGAFVDMIEDLLSLWNSFCDENSFVSARIEYVGEVIEEQ